MREQWFLMYLPVLILILVEVISMPHDAEGFSSSMVQQRSRRSSRNATRMASPDATYQLRNEENMRTKISTRGKKARNDEKGTDHPVGRNLRIKNQLFNRSDKPIPQTRPWWQCKEFPVAGNQAHVGSHQKHVTSPEVPDTDEPNSDDQSSVDPTIDFGDTMTDDMPPENVSDMDETDPDIQPDDSGLSVDSQIPVIQPDSILAQIISILMQLGNKNPLRPGSVIEIDVTNSHLPKNHSKPGLDFATLLDPNFIRIATLLLSQRDTGLPEPNFTEMGLSRSDIVYIVDTELTVICRLMKLLIYQLEQHTPVTNLLLKVIQIIINLLSSLDTYDQTIGEQEPLLPSIEYLNTSEAPTNPQKPHPESVNPLESILDYLEPLKPDTQTQPPPKESVNLPQSVLDYLESSSPVTEPQKPTQSKNNLVDSIKSVVDLLNPFKPKSAHPKTVRTIVRKLDNSERQTDSSTPVSSRTRPIGSHVLKMKPFAVGRRSGYSPSARGILSSIESMINQLNPFKPATNHQTPPESGDIAPTPADSILDHLNPVAPVADSILDHLNPLAPAADDQTSPPQNNNPLDPDHSIVDHLNPLDPATDDRTRGILSSIESLINQLNPFKPATNNQTPSESGDILPKPNDSILDHLNPLAPAADDQTSPPQNNIPLDSDQSILDHLNPSDSATDDQIRDLLSSIESLINQLNPFKPATNHQTPSESGDSAPKPTDSILDNLNPLAPATNDQTSPPENNIPLDPDHSILDHLNPSDSATDDETRGLLSSIESLINQLNPFKPAANHQKPSESGDTAPKPTDSILDHLNPLAPAADSILNHLNPLAPAADDQTSPPQNNIPLDPDHSILDHQTPLKPATNDQTSPLQNNDAIHVIKLLVDYLNAFKPATNTQASPPQNNNPNNLVESIVDYVNAFKPATNYQTSAPQNNNPPNPIESLVDYLNSIKPAPNDQTSPQNNNPPSPIQSIVDYLNSIKPATNEQTSPQNNNLPNPIQSIVDYLDAIKPATNDQKSTLQNNHPLSPIDSFVAYLNSLKPPTRGQKYFELGNSLPKPIQSIIQHLNPFKPQSENPEPVQSGSQNLENHGPDSARLQPVLRPYINPMEAHIPDLNSYGTFGPAPKSSRLAKHRPKPFKQMNGNANLLGSLKVTNSLASRSRPAYSLPIQNRIQRRTREVNCPNIPSDYYKIEGIPRAYKLHTSNLNWQDAQLKCQSEAAQLALPADEPQYNFMIKYARNMINNNDFHFYAGFRRLFSGGSWRSVLGDPLPFEKWSNGAPDSDFSDKQCGGILVSDNDVEGFTSELCASPLPFMCEMMIPPQCA